MISTLTRPAAPVGLSHEGETKYKTSCSIFLLLTLCLLSACATQQAAPTMTNWQTKGCLDKEAMTCVDNLKTEVILNPVFLQLALRDYNKIDINGKRIVPKDLTLEATSPGFDRNMTISLNLDDAGIVKSVNVGLPADPQLATTQTDFQKTGLFEATVLALGSLCPDVTADQIDKFFYNEVKPAIVKDPTTTSYDLTSAVVTHGQHAHPQTFCERQISFTWVGGVDTSLIDLTNPTGSYFRAIVTYK